MVRVSSRHVQLVPEPNARAHVLRLGRRFVKPGWSLLPSPPEATLTEDGEAPLAERWAARLRGYSVLNPLAGLATVAAWVFAALSWIGLGRLTARGSGLGFDSLISWRAEKLFAHGISPYEIKGFVYPPSCALLFRPLATLSHDQLVIGGVGFVAVLVWATGMLAASAVGRKWWGLSAAVTIWLLSYASDARGELSLENSSILGALALALFYVFARRGRWTAAGVVIGLSLAIKPLLLVVLLVFVLARKWKALATAIAVPVVLNLVALAVVPDPGRVWSKLPSILNRSGSGVNFNSAWVDVVRTLGLPEGVSILLRLLTALLVLVCAWLCWTKLADVSLRTVTTASVLLIGSYLSGTLSESHFMLTLVPLAMTVVIPRSPIRTVTAVVGILWTMGNYVPPLSWLGVNKFANNSAYRAFGMTLLLLTVTVVLARRQRRFPPTETTEAAGFAAPREIDEAVSA